MDMSSRPRILLYSHDGYGLGHFRRCLSIGAALEARLPEAAVLCVTGSPRAHAFPLPRNFDYVKLPSVTKDTNGHYAPESLALRIDEIRRLRERILFETAMNFAPDVVLVDHAPAGLEGEMCRTLRELRARRPGVKLLLGLRDIVDDPVAVRTEWERLDIPSLLEATYDRILIYGMKAVYDLPEAYGFSPAARRKSVFAGYLYRNGALIPAVEIRRRLGLSSEKLVVATVGGGGDGHKILQKLLQGIERSRPRVPFHLLVVTGPLMSDRKRSRIEALAARSPLPVRVERFIPDLLDHIRAADLVVTMGGYNSVCEILALRRPAIVVPRVFPRKEQWIRAKRFAELGLLTALDQDTLRPTELARAVEEAVFAPERSRARRSRIDFEGLDRVADTLVESLSGDRASRLRNHGSHTRPHLRATTPTDAL